MTHSEEDGVYQEEFLRSDTASQHRGRPIFGRSLVLLTPITVAQRREHS